MKQKITILRTTVTSLLLMGTSLNSLGFEDAYCKLDSNKVFSVDGTSSTVRISTPTIAMYRRADTEIAVNMNEEIKSDSKKKTTAGSVHQADIEIHYNFYNQFRINTFRVPSKVENEIIFQLFHAENIQFSTSFCLKVTDDIIHGQFMDDHQR